MGCCASSTNEKIIQLSGKFQIVITRENKVLLTHEETQSIPEMNTPVVWEYILDNDKFRNEFLLRANRTTFATYFVGAKIVSMTQDCVEVNITVRESENSEFTLSYLSYIVRFFRRAE